MEKRLRPYEAAGRLVCRPSGLDFLRRSRADSVTPSGLNFLARLRR